MSVKFHVLRRIAESLGDVSFKENIFPCASMFYRNSSESEYIQLHVPIKLFQNNFNWNKHCIVNMEPDEHIHKISETKVYSEDLLIFNINKNSFIKDTLTSSLSTKEDYSTQTKPRVLVEFSSPNIAKPFHMGHLRSTIVGNFVANLLSENFDVTKINYLGDWGTQIGFVKAGLSCLKTTKEELTENPIREMYNAYVNAYNTPGMIEKAREIFSNLEQNESEENVEWEQIRTATINNLSQTYRNLGITFDEYSFESMYRANKISALLDNLINKKYASFNKNQLVMDINGVSVPLLRENGTTLYFSRDIAAALDRIDKHSCSKIMYVVDKSQAQHLERLKIAIDIIIKKDIIEHISFGRIIGMSTRKGTSIFLDDILENATNIMAEQQKKSSNTKVSDFETTRTLGLSALIIYLLKQRRNRDFQFNWDLAVQGTGDTGVKLQYTHSRLHSLEEKFKNSMTNECEPSLLYEPIAMELILHLSQLDNVLEQARQNLESYYLVNYLFKLCNLCSKSLKLLPVRNQPNDVASQRLLLFQRTRKVLNVLMKTLGIHPLDKM